MTRLWVARVNTPLIRPCGDTFPRGGRLGAVSYTHLDVYKRQTHDLAAGAADHEDIPSFQVRGFQQFFSSLPGLCGKFCVIHEKARCV